MGAAYPVVSERHSTVREINEKLDTLVASVKRQDVALFAKSEDNEFESLGIMVIMRKFDAHLNTLCGMARLCRKVATVSFSLAAGLAGTIAAGSAAGWW